MKNIILKYYFKITALCVFSGLLIGCSGLKVMIETEQPDDDFVVECSWASSSFKIHGGKSEVHSDAFVASSGEIIDCGVLWYGVGPGIQIFHPLYIYDSDYEKTIYDSDGKVDYIVHIYKLKLKEKYLDELIKTLKRKNLVRVAKDRMSGNFSESYLLGYKSVKKIDTNYFKKKYEKRFTQYWEKLLPIIQGEYSNEILRNYTVNDFVNNYWKRLKAYEYEREDEDE